MTPDELDQDWRRECRADDLLSRLTDPPPAEKLVEAVLFRITGTQTPPDPVLAGLAAGYAAEQWDAPGSVLQLQIGLLIRAAMRAPTARAVEAVEVHTVLSTSAAEMALKAWRNRAEIDQLTGLRNRYGMQTDVAILHAGSQEYAYASIDLDGLKIINDSQGHDAGDSHIRSFASRLAARIGSMGGKAFRHGGDESSAVLSGEPAKLFDALRELQGEATAQPFSWGIAIWPDDDSDPETVHKMADRRMYAMKSEHRAPVEEED